jgi:hypothetical protein
MNREARIAERVAFEFQAKTWSNEKAMLSDLIAMYVQSQEWEKMAVAAGKAGQMSERMVYAYTSFCEMMERAWGKLNWLTHESQGKMLIGSESGHNRVALRGDGYPVRMTIKPNMFGGNGWTVKSWHSYMTSDPLKTALGLIRESGQCDAVINGIRFEGANPGSLEIALKLFFKKYQILEKTGVLERTSRDMTASKWPTVKAMRMDLTAMLDQFEEWMEKEKEAVAEVKAGFDFRPYYQTAFDAIEDAEEKVKKVENHV